MDVLNMRLKAKGNGVMSLPVSGAFTCHDVSAAPRDSSFSSPTVARSVLASCQTVSHRTS
jgi:hypothetical protein